jgi:hypothetical protein
MKKTILTLMFIAGVMTLTAQTSSRKTIATEKHYKVYESVIGVDTMVYYYFSFQNQKYQHITDLGSIMLFKKEDVLLMQQQLKEYAEITEKITQSVKTLNYQIAIYDFSNNIYLTDSKGKYTTLTKKEAIKLSESMSSYLNHLK